MKKKISAVILSVFMIFLTAANAFAGAKPAKKNIALDQQVSATSSYVPAEGFFDASFLVDGEWETYAGGNVKLGWNTNPYDDLKETDKVDVTISLDKAYLIDRIVLKPMKWGCGDAFPRNFELQFSTDGTDFKTVITVKDANAHAEDNVSVQPFVYDIEPVTAKFFRVHITRQSAVIDNSGSYTSALGEIELYGDAEEEETELHINKPALVMNPGETDLLYLVGGEAGNTAFRSSDESVVKVGADGTVTSVSEGAATITAADKNTGKEYECSVTVRTYKASDHFQIVAFMPYFKGEDVNETTFDNLKKGGITNVELNFALAADAITYEKNIRALELAYERGLDVTVSERSFNGAGWQNFSDAKILDFVRRYSHLPGVAAYYVVDEPAASTQFARAISLIKSVMPGAVAHMNYCGAYKDNVTALQRELESKYGLSLDYVMYDAYVFMQQNCNENTLYGQLRYNSAISRELGVPGACYIQAMNWNNNHRPNADEIRYQVFAALAGGVKQISYFCWRTPAANAAETYGPAVIDINNQPTDLFEPVCAINAQVNALGPTLMKLETENIYHTGTNFGTEYTPLPLGFFIQPNDPDQKLTVSYMTEKDTGRDYAMIVNRDYRNAATVSFTADKGIKKLEYISTGTGEPLTFKTRDGVYSVDLLPGEGVLVRADENYEYVYREITDFRALQKAVEEAEALDLSQYREDGIEAFRKALEEAKNVLANDGAKQSKVDNAKKALVTAQSKLKPADLTGVNLAEGAAVTADNSYEEGTYFSRNYINDGLNVPLDESTHAGWSVDPYSRIKRNSPVDVTLDLGEVYAIHTVIVKPCIYNNGGLFPTDYEIQLSEDGKEWKTVASFTDAKGEDGDQTVENINTSGRYLRVHITKHSEKPDNTGGYLSQIGEIEAYGSLPGEETKPVTTEAVTEPASEPQTEEAPKETEKETQTIPATEPAAEQTAEAGPGGRNNSVLPVVIAAAAVAAAAAVCAVIIAKKRKK